MIAVWPLLVAEQEEKAAVVERVVVGCCLQVDH